MSQLELSWAEVMPQRAASARASSAAWRRRAGLGGGIFGLDQVPRSLAENACRLTGSIVIDFAAFRSLGLASNAADFQCYCVGDGDVSIHSAEHRGMAASNRVKVLTRRQLAARPQRVVPAATHQPIAGSRGFGAGRDALLHLLQRFHAAQVHTLGLEAGLFQVHVGIVESRHDEVPAEINDLRVRALQLADFLGRTYGDNAIVAHRHRLDARGASLSVDIAVDEDDVGELSGGFARSRVG